MPTRYMAIMTKARKLMMPQAYSRTGMKAAIKTVYTGSLALQLISGAIRIVVSRSRRFSMTRVAMMPGMAQANDDKSGMNDLPLRPTRVITRSIK